jgi:hypothetical protein
MKKKSEREGEKFPSYFVDRSAGTDWRRRGK